MDVLRPSFVLQGLAFLLFDFQSWSVRLHFRSHDNSQRVWSWSSPPDQCRKLFSSVCVGAADLHFTDISYCTGQRKAARCKDECGPCTWLLQEVAVGNSVASV